MDDLLQRAGPASPAAQDPDLSETVAPAAGAELPSPGSLAPGAVVDGRFRIEHHLASGGMGEVYVAAHVFMKRRVALKVISPSFAADPEMGARFQREAELVGRLESPYVVRVFDFGRCGASFYLAMELIDGVSLDVLLAEAGALPPGRAVPLLLQVAEAVAEAHGHAIVHRDLKPANVLVARRPDGSELAKVLDFGIARVLGTTGSPSLTSPGLIMGSPSYMSPEAALGQPDVDGRADQYSFGAMAFELLTGRPPFASGNLQELLAMHISRPAPSPTEVRPELCAFPGLLEVIQTCLAKERERRFPDMRVLCAALAAALGEAPRPRTAAPPPPPRPIERQRSDLPAGESARRAPAGKSGLAAGPGWAPVTIGSVAAPPLKLKPTVSPPPGPNGSTAASAPTPRATANQRVAALSSYLEGLVPHLSRGEVSSLLSDRLKGFGKRRGVVLAVAFSQNQLSRENLAALKKGQAVLVQVAAAYGLGLDWLDSSRAVLLLDGEVPANLGQRAVRAALAAREAVQAELGATRGLKLAVTSGAWAMPTDAGPCSGQAVDAAHALAAALPEDAVAVQDTLGRDLGPGLSLLASPAPGSALVDRAVSTFLCALAAPVGRDAELQELLSLPPREGAPQRRTALLLGGPGTGKTWLLDELVARARAAGQRVAHARDLRSQDVPEPLAGVAELMAGLCGLPERAPSEQLVEVLATLGLPPPLAAAARAIASLGEPTAAPPTPGEAAFVLLSVAQAASGDAGALFVFDDLDYAQRSTHELVTLLCERLPQRFALVASAQSAATPALAALPRLPLEPLGRAATGDLVKALTGAAPLPALLEYVFRQSAGVPEMAVDCVQVLAQRGYLTPSASQGCSFATPLRPLDTAARTAARAEVLDPTARRCLEALCLCPAGRAFAPGEVETVLGVGAAPEAWSGLSRSALVRERAGEFRVPSRRHRAAVLARLGEAAREPHRRWADVLQSRPGEARARARHLAEGKKLEEALALWQQEADAAIRRREHRAAALLLWDSGVALEKHGRQASQLAPAAVATRLVVDLARGAALALATGDVALATAIAAPLEQGRHVDGVGPAAAFEMLLVLSRLKLRRGDLAGSSKLLAWLPQAHPANAKHPMVLAERADLHMAAGSPALAVDLLREAVDGVRDIAEIAFWHGEIDLEARLLARLGDVLFTQGEIEPARSAYGGALVAFQASHHRSAEARVLASLGALTAQAGALDDSIHLFEGAHGLAQACGDLLLQAQAELRIGQVLWHLDDPENARAWTRAAQDLAAQLGWDEGVQFAKAMGR
ncbi:MAG: protein kinase [Myxococcales bacterium]